MEGAVASMWRPAAAIHLHEIYAAAHIPGWIPARPAPTLPRSRPGAMPATLGDETVPLGRKGTVDEIAAMVRLLVGPEGGSVTGQTIHVHGGAFLT